MEISKTKKYFIRERSFGYNDEYSFIVGGIGNLKDQFDDRAEAMKELKRLTRQALAGISPEDFETISYCNIGNNEPSKRLHEYIFDNFGVPFLVPNTYNDQLSPNRDFSFPQDLTEEQAMEIREISGIIHFDLVEVDEKGHLFYGVKLGSMTKEPGEWISIGVARHSQETGYVSQLISAYYNSEDDARTNLPNYGILKSLNEGKGIKGSYEELSAMPQVLKSFVENHNSIEYDEDLKEIDISYLKKEDLVTLNGFLKEKIFTIEPFPMSLVEQIGNGWFLEM